MPTTELVVPQTAPNHEARNFAALSNKARGWLAPADAGPMAAVAPDWRSMTSGEAPTRRATTGGWPPGTHREPRPRKLGLGRGFVDGVPPMREDSPR